MAEFKSETEGPVSGTAPKLVAGWSGAFLAVLNSLQPVLVYSA